MVDRCAKCGGEIWSGEETNASACCPRCDQVDPTIEWHPPPLPTSELGVGDGMRRLLDLLDEQYQIGPELGRGGLGTVYQATLRRSPNTTIAIKVLRQSFDTDDDGLRRFLREISIGLGLDHPRIVRVLDHGQQAGCPYFVMEYCNEGSLETLSRRRHNPPLLKRLKIFELALQGMEYAHGRQLVHRDLKPANILLHRGPDKRVRPKIADFGLAKCVALHSSSKMTATGSFGGTLQYMPREQVLDFRKLTPTGDVWSLGAVLFRLLTGRYVRDTPAGRDPIDVILNDVPPPCHEAAPELPDAVAAIIDRAIAIDPADRFQNAGEMRAAVCRVLEDS